MTGDVLLVLMILAGLALSGIYLLTSFKLWRTEIEQQRQAREGIRKLYEHPNVGARQERPRGTA